MKEVILVTLKVKVVRKTVQWTAETEQLGQRMITVLYPVTRMRRQRGFNRHRTSSWTLTTNQVVNRQQNWLSMIRNVQSGPSTWKCVRNPAAGLWEQVRERHDLNVNEPILLTRSDMSRKSLSWWDESTREG